MIERAVAAEELGPVAGPGDLPSGEVGERDAVAELGAPGIAREHRSGLGIDLGHDERRGGARATLPSTHSTYAVTERRRDRPD